VCYLLTSQCWPRCTVRSFNSMHFASLGAPYGYKCISGCCKLRALHPLQWLSFQPQLL
jgi:hypothetical protein